MKCSVSRLRIFLSKTELRMGPVSQRRPCGMRYCSFLAISDCSSELNRKKSMRMFGGMPSLLMHTSCSNSSSVCVLQPFYYTIGRLSSSRGSHPINAVMIEPADAPLITLGSSPSANSALITPMW